MIDHDHWLEAQQEEVNWWGTCANTFHEEEKQMVYARYMGLEFYEDHQSPYNIDLAGKYVLDIGGGPSSLLLKTKNGGSSVVVDPCRYPDWVLDRYEFSGIILWQKPAEEINIKNAFDEVWMYNVLQHTEDPALIIQNGLNALRHSGVFRIFEWIDTAVNEAHPHSLTEDFFNEAFNERGDTVRLATAGCFGKAYYGEFKK
jgi:2-polyprenyl-3-methyl-5-hydroxy-6-metoxy-1,4-benzoquinol methylase